MLFQGMSDVNLKGKSPFREREIPRHACDRLQYESNPNCEAAQYFVGLKGSSFTESNLMELPVNLNLMSIDGLSGQQRDV